MINVSDSILLLMLLFTLICSCLISNCNVCLQVTPLMDDAMAAARALAHRAIDKGSQDNVTVVIITFTYVISAPLHCHYALSAQPC